MLCFQNADRTVSPMTQPRPWPAELTRAMGRAIRHYRTRRGGMSAEQLAEAVSIMGLRYTRTQVSNLESGRRDSVTVGEVFAFAAALDVPAVLLLLPIGSAEAVELLPNRSTDPWTAYRWMLGELTMDELANPDPKLRVTRSVNVVSAYRRHDTGIRNYFNSMLGDDQALAMIAGARVEMQEKGWWRPPLPDGVADALRPVLLAFGWQEDPPGELSRVEAAELSEGGS